MRIALVSPYSLSRPGGVQGQVLGLARALRRLGHIADVLGPVDGQVESGGLPAQAIVSLGRSIPIPANGSVAPLALLPASSWKIVRSVRQRRYDLVHLHEPFAPGPTWACMLACHLPLVATFHRAGMTLEYKLVAPAARLAAGRLAARCAVSGEAAETAASLIGGDFTILYNGVEVERFTAAEPWPADRPTVMFVGRHEPRKGLSVLLAAWQRLRDGDGIAGRLWVAGEGPQTAELRRSYPGDDRVEWLGALDDAELASRLAGAHVLCAPALRGESFGVVLVEALAARCAIVASDIPGYAAVVGRDGVLVPPGDPIALACALRQVMDDVAQSEGRGSSLALEAGVERARQWSMDNLARQYAGIYSTVSSMP